jgi:RNA polymerase sigma-70 factor (ECF subfamily)
MAKVQHDEAPLAQPRVDDNRVGSRLAPPRQAVDQVNNGADRQRSDVPPFKKAGLHQDLEEIDLARRSAAGDTAAFEEIVSRYSTFLWRTAMALLHDTSAAEEVAQDTFVRAFRHLQHFRGESSLRTWLDKICRNVCLDRIRRERGRVPVRGLEENHHLLSLSSLERHYEEQKEADLRSFLTQEIKALPEPQREAFILVYLHGYSREAAADILNIPAPTMRDRVLRARRRLAQAFLDYRAEPAPEEA